MIELRRHPKWLILGSVIIAAALVGGTLRIFSTSNQPSDERTLDNQTSGEEPAELFKSPIVSLSAQLRGAARPDNLLVSTSSPDRLATVSAGRDDPFAPVVKSNGGPIPPRSTAKSNTSTGVTSPQGGDASTNNQSLPSVPVSNSANLPPLPSVSWSPVPPPLPAIPIAANPVPVPVSPNYATPLEAPLEPMQAIEVSGVVQVGNRVGIIARESSQQTSRHFFAGDYLVGGQVLVKSIDLSAQEPLIILEYQGKEYPRTVGSGGQLGVS